ncbi:hypothetical protein LCGC14_0834050 [marine sediment metagenome]|uniref:Phage tail tape measure protein domain-containing protein n=1 Tax=marine sediment metagenome TaxID=412755 RepID=A0A0F9RZT3_9ZZZZ
MANFSSSDVLLSAVVEIRVKEDALRKDLARAKQTVQQTTDAMTKVSISKMKNRSMALMRLNKLDQQQTVRGVQAKIAANRLLGKTVAKSISENKKAATVKIRNDREVARIQREEISRLGRMSSAFRMLGVQVTIAGAIITATFKKMLDQFISFDTAMRRATAVTTFSLQQYTKMSSMAENVSMRLNIAASSTADAFYFLGSAGLNAEQQMKAFIPVVTLAKAAVIDAGQAAEIMVDTMKGFKIPFEETAHVAAVMAKSVISSNMNFLQLGETLSLVAGVARTTNNTLEETNAMIQLMANVGIKGTRAGTTLRRSMLNLSAPSEKIKRLFRGLNIEIEDQTGKIKPYIQLIGEISDALADATEGQKQMAFKTLFGARAIAGQIELFAAGSAELQHMALQLKLVGDTHEEIAKKQLVAFGEEVGKMKQGIANLSRLMASKFVPTLKMMTGWIDKLIKKITKASDKHKILSNTVVGTGLAMGGLLLIAGASLTTLASLALVASGLGVSFGVLIAVSAGVLAALTAIVAISVFFISRAAEAKAKIEKFNESILKNEKFIIAARKATQEWSKSLGSLGPSEAMIQTQDYISRTIERITEANAMLKQLGILRRTANNIPDKWIVETFRRRGIRTFPKIEPTRRDVGRQRFGTGLVIDREAALDTLIRIERAQITSSKKTLDILNKHMLDLVENRRKANVGANRLEKVWREETLEDVVNMYSEMRGHDIEYFDFSVALLKKKQQAMLDDFELREFLSEETKKTEIANFKAIQNEHRRQLEEQLLFDKAMRSESFAEGFTERIKQMQRDTRTLGEVGAEAADIFRDGFADALSGMTQDIRNWKDVFVSAIRSIENALINLAAQQVATQIFARASGGGIISSLGGSLLGMIGGSSSAGPGMVAATGPHTFHSGGLVGSGRGRRELQPDEFPAVLQSGERVLRRGERKNNSERNKPVIINVNITAMDSRSVFTALKPLKKEIATLVQSASRDNHTIRRN